LKATAWLQVQLGDPRGNLGGKPCVYILKDWEEKLDSFLKLSGKALLSHAGKINHELVEKKALAEYGKYRERTKEEISKAERDFLESIGRVGKMVEGKG
jgi:hypothetical protein